MLFMHRNSTFCFQGNASGTRACALCFRPAVSLVSCMFMSVVSWTSAWFSPQTFAGFIWTRRMFTGVFAVLSTVASAVLSEAVSAAQIRSSLNGSTLEFDSFRKTFHRQYEGSGDEFKRRLLSFQVRNEMPFQRDFKHTSALQTLAEAYLRTSHASHRKQLGTAGNDQKLPSVDHKLMSL